MGEGLSEFITKNIDERKVLTGVGVLVFCIARDGSLNADAIIEALNNLVESERVKRAYEDRAFSRGPLGAQTYYISLK